MLPKKNKNMWGEHWEARQPCALMWLGQQVRKKLEKSKSVLVLCESLCMCTQGKFLECLQDHLGGAGMASRESSSEWRREGGCWEAQQDGVRPNFTGEVKKVILACNRNF